MRLEIRYPRRLGRQRGVSLVAAIFVMVVLGALGGYIVSVTVFQQVGTTLSLQSARAHAAASSGVDWAVWYIRTNDNCPPDGTSFTIGQFTVTQNSGCTKDLVTEGGSTYNLFNVQYTASTTGSSFGSSDYASRTQRAMVLGP